jgi:hypothetical protein
MGWSHPYGSSPKRVLVTALDGEPHSWSSRGPQRRADEERETGEQAEGAVVATGTRFFLLSRLA